MISFWKHFYCGEKKHSSVKFISSKFISYFLAGVGVACVFSTKIWSEVFFLREEFFPDCVKNMNLRQGISAKRKESIFSPWQLFLREILFRCRKVSFFLRMVAKRFYNGFLLLPLGHLYNKEKNCEPKTSFFRRTSMTDKIPDEIQTSLLNRGLRHKKIIYCFQGFSSFHRFTTVKS